MHCKSYHNGLPILIGLHYNLWYNRGSELWKEMVLIGFGLTQKRSDEVLGRNCSESCQP